MTCHVNILANLQSRVRKGKMTPEKFEKAISLLKGALDYESFKDVDIVIEVIYTSSFFFYKKVTIINVNWVVLVTGSYREYLSQATDFC